MRIMKKLKIYFLSVAISSLVVIASCGDDDDGGTSPEDQFAANIGGSWSATEVRLDGNDVTDPSYLNFTIQFNEDGSYVTSDGDPVFTDQGGFYTVTSVAGDVGSITLDGVAATLTVTGETTATLGFTATGEAIGARGLEGAYVFSLSK